MKTKNFGPLRVLAWCGTAPLGDFMGYEAGYRIQSDAMIEDFSMGMETTEDEALAAGVARAKAMLEDPARAREDYPGLPYQWWTTTDGLRLDQPAPPPASETVTNERGGKQSRLPFHPSRFPHAVWLAILVVLEQGAAKYDAHPGEQNWRKIPVAEHIEHARVHIYLWLDGDRKEPHLIHAICRLAFAAAMMMDTDTKPEEG